MKVLTSKAKCTKDATVDHVEAVVVPHRLSHFRVPKLLASDHVHRTHTPEGVSGIDGPLVDGGGVDDVRRQALVLPQHLQKS